MTEREPRAHSEDLPEEVVERALPREHRNFGSGEEVVAALRAAGLLAEDVPTADREFGPDECRGVARPAPSGPARIEMMPPSPETATVWYSVYCRDCGIEEGMAHEKDSPMLIEKRDRHNLGHHVAKPSAEQPTDEQVERAALAVRAEMRPERKDAGSIYRDHDVHEYLNVARAALAAAGVAPPAPSDYEHGVLERGDLLHRLMDTLAYYHCRSTNPKADHPSMGYHAFSEDQREFLREKQREAAEEVLRMWNAEGRPAPSDDREKLIASLRRVAAVLEEYEFEDHASEAAGLMNSAAEALAAQAPVDEAKLAEVIREKQTWTKRMSDGYLSTGSNSPEEIARAVREYLNSL